MKMIQRIERAAPAIKKRLRVAAYARVSVESERMKHSLSAQVSYYSARIQQRPDWEYAGVYADYGISGTGTAKREAFQRMLADCEAGRIDLVLTKSIQRFARNTVDLLQTVRRLKELGIEVYFEKEYIETALYLISTPNTGLFFTYCSIYCGFIGVSEPAHCGLSLICRLNLQ